MDVSAAYHCVLLIIHVIHADFVHTLCVLACPRKISRFFSLFFDLKLKPGSVLSRANSANFSANAALRSASVVVDESELSVQGQLHSNKKRVGGGGGGEGGGGGGVLQRQMKRRKAKTFQVFALDDEHRGRKSLHADSESWLSTEPSRRVDMTDQDRGKASEAPHLTQP